MTMLLPGVLVLSLASSVLAAPLSDTRPQPLALARSAVDTYNQQSTRTQELYRLLQVKNVKRQNFDWGAHFTIDFVVKETQCRKSGGYSVKQCKYKEKGQTLTCSAEVTVQDFAQEAPLSSVTCRPPGAKKQSNKQSDGPGEIVTRHFPSAYSTAALEVPPEDGAADTR
ncbi:cathelicidin-2-like [Discoglossus pictus]